MTKSTRKRASSKPSKPSGFPLWEHPSGRWCKKIRGRFCYFGKVADDPEGEDALKRYQQEREDLEAGRTPRPAGEAGGLTVRELVNRFLTSKQHKQKRGEITARTFRDLHSTCARIVDVFGRERPVVDLEPSDFERLHNAMAKTMGLLSRKTEIQKTRSVFKWAFDEGLIDKPVRFGQGFRPASKRELRKAKAGIGNGGRMFEAHEILALLAAATPHFRAMILLGVNCGFGNMDIATLKLSGVDLEAGWIDHPRPKTGTERRCPLWPETIQSLREAIARRPKPKDPAHADLVFLTRQHGNPWVRFECKDPEHPENGAWNDAITIIMRKLLGKLGLKRPGRGFYSLRHTFETISGESVDQVSTDYLMGHVDNSMAAVYRERISDDRLRAVVNHVHEWLFEQPAGDDEGEQPDVVKFAPKKTG